MLGAEVRGGTRYVCSDMWQPYLKVIAEQIEQAVHVLDRFQIMKNTNAAIDQVRRVDAKRLERDGYEPVLKRSRWCEWHCCGAAKAPDVVPSLDPNHNILWLQRLMTVPFAAES